MKIFKIYTHYTILFINLTESCWVTNVLNFTMYYKTYYANDFLIQVLCTLNYLASGSYQKRVG